LTRAWITIALVIICACTEQVELVPNDAARLPATRFLSEATGNNGYARVFYPKKFQFPRDHGSHPEYRTEWWYFTGNLEGARARHYGFELAFFRYALKADEAEGTSAWRASQAWMAHFALTDTQGNKFFADERLSREAIGLAGNQRVPFRVWVEDWSATSVDAEFFPIRLKAGNENAKLDLTLMSSKPPIANGDRGMDRKGPGTGNASYYYSMTRLQTAGFVQVGSNKEMVNGFTWMDREWGTNTLSDDLEGWDWFSVQLSDNTELMYYRLRHRDGSASPYSGGSIVDATGNHRSLSADAVLLTALDHWKSPNSARTYPVAWKLEVPDEDLVLEIEPYLLQQELNLTVRYWEGAIRVIGERQLQPIDGSGYLELAGY